MTHTKQFIEDAKKAGYFPFILPFCVNEKTTEQQLLDPLAWQAVGKTRGWLDDEYIKEWSNTQHRFIDHLADGKSIEEALAALTN